MKKKNTLKTNIMLCCISAVVFFCVTVPCRHFFALLTVTEVRPASVFPPIFGLLFGIWGAIGCAIGNFAADLLSGYGLSLSLASFLLQVIAGYVPYVMWYNIRTSEDKEYISYPVMNSVKNVLKFVGIMFVNSIIWSFMITSLLKCYGIAKVFSLMTLTMFLNNFDFVILIGLPLLTFITVQHLPINVPQKNGHTLLNPKLYDLAYLLGVIIILFEIAVELLKIDVNPIINTIVLSLMFAVYCLKPKRLVSPLYDYKKHSLSLNEKMITEFMITGVVLTAITGILGYTLISKYVSDKVIMWNELYFYIAIVLNSFFIGAVLFLKYIEKSITFPVKQISDIAGNYVSESGEKIDSAEAINQCATFDYDKTEIGTMARSIKKMLSDLDIYMENIKRNTAEKERISAELGVATKIQNGMIPKKFPAFENFSSVDLYASMTPAKEVGGDFYDFFEIDDDHVAIVIADVSGKGVPAAMFMAISKMLIKAQLMDGKTPAEAFTNANVQLCSVNDAGMFVTAFAGIIEVSTGKFTYVNAGHNPPLLMHNGEKAEYVKLRPGFVLAGLDTIKYKQFETTLTKGDLIFVYTDGMTECINKESELYGEDRLRESLDKNSKLSLEEMLSNMKKEADYFASGLEQFDDMTMLVVKMN